MANAKSTKPRLFNVEITLTENAVTKQNSNKKDFVLARGTLKGGRKQTIMSYVKSGIAALAGAQSGQTIRLYGTYSKGTFSAMGISPAKPAPAVAAAA